MVHRVYKIRTIALKIDHFGTRAQSDLGSFTVVRRRHEKIQDKPLMFSTKCSLIGVLNQPSASLSHRPWRRSKQESAIILAAKQAAETIWCFLEPIGLAAGKLSTPNFFLTCRPLSPLMEIGRCLGKIQFHPLQNVRFMYGGWRIDLSTKTCPIRNATFPEPGSRRDFAFT
jgi:hypothetical protein